MIPESAKRLRGIHGPHGFTREDNLSTGIGDAQAQFVIVSERIRNGFEAAHLSDPVFRRGDGSAQRKANAFLPSGHQHAREEIARCADGLQLGAKVVLNDGAIKRRYSADCFVV